MTSAPRAGSGSSSLRALVVHPGADLYGSDRVLLETVCALVEGGWTVTASVPADGPLVAMLVDSGARVQLCPTPVLRKSALRPWGLIRLAVETAKAIPSGIGLIRRARPDVLVANTITIPLWTVLGRLLRRPVLVHVHEAEGSVSMARQRAMATPLLLATGLVANSRCTRDVIARSYARLGRRTSVVYNGVAGPPAPDPPRPRIDGPARLLFVGRLSPRKGPAVAIRALSLLRHKGIAASLDVVGDVFPGYEWFSRDLTELVEQEGVADAVRFHGFVPDIWPRIAATDMMIVPSQADESFGNTAIEAILGARPLVVSAIGGLLEATEGMGAVRSVRPGDPGALADGVDEVLSDWARFAECAGRDARVAVERYAPARYRREMRGRVAELVRR